MPLVAAVLGDAAHVGAAVTLEELLVKAVQIVHGLLARDHHDLVVRDRVHLIVQRLNKLAPVCPLLL